MAKIEYPFMVRPLSEEDGGGYLVKFPDLPGCIADGETPEEAIREAQDALEAWLGTAREFGYHIPAPGSSDSKESHSFPSPLHFRLAERAEQEGISIHTLVVSMLSEIMDIKPHAR